MTDRREAAESIAPEVEAREPTSAPAPRRTRASRSTPGAPRANPRRVLLATAVLAGLALAALAFQFLGRSLTDWLHLRPEYQVSLDSIQLSPPPPACLKGGSTTLLRQVAATSDLDGPLAVLSAKTDDLARRFALGSPWIEAVDEVALEGHPPAVSVKLRYRTPVATIAASNGGRIYLDRHGVVLPSSDIDASRTGPLIALRGWTGPVDARPGLSLAPADSDAMRRLLAGTQLCAFLTKQDVGKDDSPRIATVNIQYGDHLLYTQTNQGLWVLWGDPPGSESPDQPNAEAKWRALTDWIASHADEAGGSSGSYLVFTENGARLERNEGRGSGRSPSISRPDAG